MLPNSWIRTPSAVSAGRSRSFSSLAASDRCCIDLVPVAGQRFLVRVQNHQALVAVDDHRFAARDVGQKRPDADDRRNAQPLGHDRRVAAGPADLGDEARARTCGLRLAVSLGVRLWASTSTSAS